MFEITSGADIPDGSYPAVLEKVEADRGQFGDMRKWHWLIEVPAHKNDQGEDVAAAVVPLTQLTSANTGPQSTSYKQLSALLKRDLKAGEKVEDPTGNAAIVVIAKNSKNYPKIVDVLPKVDPQQTIEGLPR